jgi:hypothetical protein
MNSSNKGAVNNFSVLIAKNANALHPVTRQKTPTKGFLR